MFVVRTCDKVGNVYACLHAGEGYLPFVGCEGVCMHVCRCVHIWVCVYAYARASVRMYVGARVCLSHGGFSSDVTSSPPRLIGSPPRRLLRRRSVAGAFPRPKPRPSEGRDRGSSLRGRLNRQSAVATDRAPLVIGEPFRRPRKQMEGVTQLHRLMPFRFYF